MNELSLESFLNHCPKFEMWSELRHFYLQFDYVKKAYYFWSSKGQKSLKYSFVYELYKKSKDFNKSCKCRYIDKCTQVINEYNKTTT